MPLTLIAIPGGFEIRGQSRLKDSRKGCDPVLSSLSIMNQNGALPEIDVLNPELQRFGLSQSAAVYQLGNQFPRIFEMREDTLDLVSRQDGWRAPRSLPGGPEIEINFLETMNFLSKKNQGVEGLLLGGRGHLALESEKIEVLAEGSGIEFAEALTESPHSEATEASDPVKASLFSRDGQSGKANGPAGFGDEFGDGLLLARRGRVIGAGWAGFVR